MYDNFKIPLHPDSADRRLPNGLFIRAEDVGCRAVRGAGSVFAVRLYSLTVKECIVRACQEMGCTIGDMQIGLLCPDSWDEETKMAVENSILCLRIPTPEDNVERIEHVHRCQLVWIRESQASFLSAVVDAEVPPGRSTTIVADVGGHTTDLMAMTINNVPHQETRLQDVLAQRGRRLGGNEVDDTLKEFLFLHFFEPLGVTRARMLNNPNAVYELRSQLEELKTTHDPSRIATTDEEKLARPRQKTHHELDLRNIEDLFPDKNWMAAFAERVGVLNQRPDNPLPFFEAEGPQRIQGVRNFRDRLANAPYVPGDKTGSFNMKGGILSLPTKLFKHVLDKHAEALVEIVLEFITAINNTPAETVSPGGTLEGDGDHERRSIKTILFTGEGATGAAHRQILRNLSAMQLLPGQPERTVYFPEGTSTHCLRGGHLILMHYRNIHRVL